MAPISKNRESFVSIIAFVLAAGILAPILLRDSVSVPAKPRAGTEWMFKAARTGKLGELKALAGRGANMNVKRSDGQTLLHVAAENGRTDCVKWLIEHGASVNARANDGSTPLHLAARMGRDDVVECLLDFQADPNMRNRRGNIPLHAALLETDSRTEVGREDTGKLLIWLRTDLTLRNNDGETALNATATRYGALLESMLDKGADPFTRDKNGDTPLHHIVQNKENEMSRRVQSLAGLLIARGVPINSRNLAGETPLHRAADMGNTRVVDFLLSSGADPRLRDNRGRTAFETPGWRGHQLAVLLVPLTLMLSGLMLTAEVVRLALRKSSRRALVYAVLMTLGSTLLPALMLRIVDEPYFFIPLTIEAGLVLSTLTFAQKMVVRCYSRSARMGTCVTGILCVLGFGAFLLTPLVILDVLPAGWWSSRLTTTVLSAGVAAGAVAAWRGFHSEAVGRS